MKTMCFAALALAAGVHAQLPEVAVVGGRRLPAINGPAFVGAGYGTQGTVVRVPAYLQQSEVRYFEVDPNEGAELRLTPERTTAAAPSRAASALACGRGWAKHPSASTCFTDIEGLKSKGWGWSNAVEPGEDVTVPVYIGAAGCETEKAKNRFDIRVTYTTGEGGAEVVVDLGNNGAQSLRSAAVYVGTEPLPKDSKGKYTDSPGQFPISVNVNDDAVIKVSERLPNLALTGTLYFAVHVNACPNADDNMPAMEPAQPVSAAVDPPACTTTFVVTVFSCLADASCVTRTTGDVQQDLIAAGFTSYNDALHFTIPATAGYQHNTRVFVKTMDAADAPLTIPASNFMGVFAAGCGTAVRARQIPTNVGPVRNMCADYCPADFAN